MFDDGLDCRVRGRKSQGWQASGFGVGVDVVSFNRNGHIGGEG